ncbi:hypothetical protein [Lichenibacterium dinghuense]|uniref:hypothetical protein n=1 Tax=Lichenibacterium dinghuense TaxID=2895977 RepID=UPI001F2444A5|nr:hypothetical protein [Lichenibacterium sp. 6Y81]
MARRRRTAATPFGLWADAMATGVATAVTLSVRVPQLLAGTMTAAESTRMVAEKAAAAGEGLLAGSAAAARVAARRLARLAPHRAVEDALEIAEAMSRPARRRVKANAARLSKR